MRAQLNPRAKDALQPALRKAGKVTAVAWLLAGTAGVGGVRAADFVTGHETGDVLVSGRSLWTGAEQGGTSGYSLRECRGTVCIAVRSRELSARAGQRVRAC